MVVSLPETTPIKKTDSLRSHQLLIASLLELGPSEHPPYFMMGLWLPLYRAGLVQATIVAMSSWVLLSWLFQKTLVLPDFWLSWSFCPPGKERCSMSICGWALHQHSLSVLWSGESSHVNHCSMLENTSLKRSKSCSNPWVERDQHLECSLVQSRLQQCSTRRLIPGVCELDPLPCACLYNLYIF